MECCQVKSNHCLRHARSPQRHECIESEEVFEFDPRRVVPICLVVLLALALVTTMIGCKGPSSIPPQSSSIVEVRLTSPVEMSGYSRTIETAGSTWYIADQALLTDRDAESAQLQTDVSGRRVVILKLAGDAATTLRNATAANLRRPLVFLLNGTVLSAPLINSEFGGMLAVTRFSGDGLTEAEANEIIAAVQSRR
jgi:hypothetical protein